MNKLQENLNEINRQKQEYIIPQNIKKDVVVFGVKGILDQENVLSPNEYHDACDTTLKILGMPTVSLYARYNSTAITEEDVNNVQTAYGCNRVDFTEEALNQDGMTSEGHTLRSLIEEYPYITLIYEYSSYWENEQNVYFSKAPLSFSGLANGTRLDLSRDEENTTYAGDGWQYIGDTWEGEGDHIAEIGANQISTPINNYYMQGTTMNLPNSGEYKDKIVIFANYELNVDIWE